MKVRRKISHVVRGLRAMVTTPPLVGAVVVVLLASWAWMRDSGDAAEFGEWRRADAAETFVEHRFATEVVQVRVGIVATAVALGLVMGLVAEILIRMRYSPVALARRRPASTLRALVETVFVCLAVYGLLVLWAMADSPQLYAVRWYAQGGLPRTTQVIATDVLGPRGVVLVTLLLAVLYVRPSRLAPLARRAASVVRRPLQLLTTRLAKRIAALSLAVMTAAIGLRSVEAPRDLFAAPLVSRIGTGKHQDPSTFNQPTSMTQGHLSGRPPNVLILAADSLRADRINSRVAPTLTRLAAKGTRFERAYVSIPQTFPSWVTILTGRHGHHHGIRSMFPTSEDRARDFDAMPQRFARAGYATSVVSDDTGDVFGRIDLGFGHVDAPLFDVRQLIRQRVLEQSTPLLPLLHSQLGRRLFAMRALHGAADPRLLADDVSAALQAASKDKPFFLTAFFSTAHSPYAAPAPYYARYTDPDYRGRFKYHKPLGLGADTPLDAADIKQIRALYDGSVSAIDDAVARVIQTLEREGKADNTILVVTADHGEMLFENGYGEGHGDHLFGDEGTHVPLFVIDPRVTVDRSAAAHTVSSAIVRDVDLAPTLYEMAGITPPADLDGRSLVPALSGMGLEPRFAYAETGLWFTEDVAGLSRSQRISYPGILALTELDVQHDAEVVLRKEMLPITLMARHRMIRDERWKLVYVPTRKGVKYMLFDTVADPSETKDVGAAHADEVKRLQVELWTWMLRDPQMEQRDGFLVPRDLSSRGRPRTGATIP